MHRLALQLAPLEPCDPAVLAFSGLGPDREHPSRDEAPPDEAEKAWLSGWPARVVEVLEERLPRTNRRGPALLDWVVRRRARVEADPGWIDAFFPLEAVSTDVRAAGLDLDPGWIPWLGVVVRFLYEG
jgi:hypothetical protein